MLPILGIGAGVALGISTIDVILWLTLITGILAIYRDHKVQMAILSGDKKVIKAHKKLKKLFGDDLDRFSPKEILSMIADLDERKRKEAKKAMKVIQKRAA